MEERGNLFLKRLFSNLDFLKIDLDYKQQKLDKYQIDFNQKIVEYLEDHPVIKEEYDKIVNANYPIPTEEYESRQRTPEEEEEFERRKTEIEDALKEEEYAENLEKRSFKEDADIRRIYREIVKFTHPDKIKKETKERQNELKKYYIEATDAYDDQNLYDIVRIATLLDLNIGDLSDENINRLEENLRILKWGVNNIERNLVWKFFEELKDDIQRKIILKEYILQFIQQNKRANGEPKTDSNGGPPNYY